ncbi:hypothetical protein SS50377_24765 [Spironucleus salmonicida]|uniref:Uncharacterized protein n=1 Tax=Spironucleus salmonicida TaxID=348837 RepID=V6LV12_9EUKA|nr:hypothetical protein SS50377_24765 [Spironucleus salmonicida]|eukprot:EST44644.1 Hypothetical protein SS50377_15653 [Spironucleus salmonicida]
MLAFDSLSPPVYSEDSLLSITDMEPIDVSGLFQQQVQIQLTKLTQLRYKQPKKDLISTANPHFYKMMESHSAIYSAFYFLTRKGLCFVPKQILDQLSIQTTKTNILQVQEQRILIYINDRKEAERKLIIREILQEPNLSTSWVERLQKMIK